MTPGIDEGAAEVRERALRTVRTIVENHLAGHRARVWLFGSCATGRINRFSDIDVAIEPIDPLPAALLSDIEEALEESTVPYFVDVVDLSHASPELRQRVLTEGIPWRT